MLVLRQISCKQYPIRNGICTHFPLIFGMNMRNAMTINVPKNIRIRTP